MTNSFIKKFYILLIWRYFLIPVRLSKIQIKHSEDVAKTVTSYTVDNNINQSSNYGKQNGGIS